MFSLTIKEPVQKFCSSLLSLPQVWATQACAHGRRTASLAVQMLILPTRRAGLGQAASLFCVRMWEGYGDTTLFNNDGSQQLALSEGLYRDSFKHHNSLAKQGLLISPFYRLGGGGETCLSPNPWTRGGGSRVTKVNHLETSGMGWSLRIESKTGCGQEDDGYLLPALEFQDFKCFPWISECTGTVQT